MKRLRAYLSSSKLFTTVTSHQLLRYTFRKVDVHGRSALGLSFLAEYDFRTEYRPDTISGAACYLSPLNLTSPAELELDEGDLICKTVSTKDFPRLEPHLVSIATCVRGLLIEHLRMKTRRETRLNLRKLAV